MTGPLRSLGRWTLTALVINSIIGSGIYGVSSEAIHLVGRSSPLAMIAAAVVMAVIMLPVAEVASQFTEPGGMYLYSRRTFGRLVGLQIGWFWLLAIVGGGAAGANLFLNYLEPFVPAVANPWPRAVVLLLVVSVPMLANYLGVRQGAGLSVVLTVAKLLPMAVVVGLALVTAAGTRVQHPAGQEVAPTLNNLLEVLLILVYSYSGWEDALVPTGEVQQPRRTLPFALSLGLGISAAAYCLLQLAIILTIGTKPSNHPAVDTASVLMGHNGALFIGVAVMISTYGWISGAFLNASRLPVSMAEEGDCPQWLGRLHPRFRTPSAGILLYGIAVFLLALTGTFLYAVAITAGALGIFYSATCAALLRLRHTQPHAPAFRVPFGPAFAVLGILLSATLLTALEPRQLMLMSTTALIALANWLWARRAVAHHVSEGAPSLRA